MLTLPMQKLSRGQFNALKDQLDERLKDLTDESDTTVWLVKRKGYIGQQIDEDVDTPFRSLLGQHYTADEVHTSMFYDRITNVLGVKEETYKRPYRTETYWSQRHAYGYYDHVKVDTKTYAVPLSDTLPEGWYDVLMTELTGKQHPTLFGSLRRKLGM